MKAAVCEICPHACKLAPGQLGLCKARVGAERVLSMDTPAVEIYVRDQSFGRITSIALDPIEKKPLARFMPGSKVVSVGSYGCNMRCAFCQNSSIACAGEDDVSWRFMSPGELVDIALQTRKQGNVGIAYTYNEPFVSYEFMLETAKLAHDAWLVNVVVTNGMVNPEPLAQILPYIDAANVDLKAFDHESYRKLGGDLDCVRATIRAMAECPSCHVEVTTLVVPGFNDDPEQIEGAAKWIASLSPEIPYHLSRFFPCHKMRDRKPTDVDFIYRMAELCRTHLKHVYTGNC